MGFAVTELAGRLGGRVAGVGDAALVLNGVCGLAEAGPEHLSFLSNRRYARLLATSRAGCVLVASEEEGGGRLVIVVDDPYAAFARALALFHPVAAPVPGVDARAVIGEGAVVEGATIEALAVIGAGAVVGPGTVVQSGAYVGAGAVVGRNCRLMATSVVADGCVLGDRVWLNPGAVVGGEGFGFAPTAAGNVKIPQTGRAVVEDDVEIGANSCVDRAAMGDTIVRRGAKLDNLVQVGHAAEIGEHSMLVAYAGVAGSSRLGRRVTLAAKAAVLGHLELGDGVTVGGASLVRDDQPAGARVTGVPAIEHRRWLRATTAFPELPELLRTVRRLERQVAELSGGETAVPEAIDLPGGGTIEAAALLALLPHRYPFLMIDRVVSVEPGARATAIKNVSADEPWAEGHFPGRPIFPGVLLVEAFAQVAGIVALSAEVERGGGAVYLVGVDGVRFRRPIVPGDTVHVTAEKVQARRGMWRFKCHAEVGGVKVGEGEILVGAGER